MVNGIQNGCHATLFINMMHGPMWFIVSLDPLPLGEGSIGYQTSDPDMATLEENPLDMLFQSSAWWWNPLLRAKNFFLSFFTSVQVLILEHNKPLNGMHALYWDLSGCICSLSSTSMSSSSELWAAIQFPSICNKV